MRSTISLRTGLAPFSASGSPEADASCTPSPCLRHYSEHSSTMGTPSPCVSRRLGDPQVTLYLWSVCRFPLRPFPLSGAGPDEGFIDTLNLPSITSGVRLLSPGHVNPPGLGS